MNNASDSFSQPQWVRTLSAMVDNAKQRTSIIVETEPSTSRLKPVPLPAITVTEPDSDNNSETVQNSKIDVDSELLALIDDTPVKPSTSTPVVPTFTTIPPVREAAKKSSKLIGKVPTTTTTVKAAPNQRRVKSSVKGSTGRGGARPRGRGGAGGSKPNSAKKFSLLAQAQENRARSLLQSQSSSAHEKPQDDAAPPDNRLYCVCKSNYDDALIMIGCDRCDEWFHPRCVSLDDSDVEQIDVYICPNCRKQNPHLQVSRKTICRRPGCDRSSRRQASKYCSDECGVLAMAALLERKKLDKKALWQAIKDVRRPDGIVVDQHGQPIAQKDMWEHRSQFNISLVQRQLNEIERQRKELKKLMAVTEARQELLDLSLARLQDLQETGETECGWDTRWLWDDGEIRRGFENGSIQDSYPDGSLNGRGVNHVPKPVSSSSSALWCIEGKDCPRHQGWVKMLQEDLELERSDQNAAQKSLAEQERVARLRLENPDDPAASSSPTSVEKKQEVVMQQPLQRKRGNKKTKG